MQPGRGVVDAAEDVEHLDQVVRRLVRRDLPHVEQVGPALARLAPGQEPRQLRIGRVALGLHVDQQRHHGGPVVAQRVQLRLVEGGVGHGEAALGGQPGQLGAPQRDLVGHRGLPVAQQRGRRDVVVVDELRLGAGGEDVVDRAADGRLVEQPAVARAAPELGDGAALVLHVGRVAAVVDVRVDARGAQPVAQVQGVHADGVATGERRNDLVDPHGAAVYRRRAHPDRAPMHQFTLVALLSWSHRAGSTPRRCAPHRTSPCRVARRARAVLRAGGVLGGARRPGRPGVPGGGRPRCAQPAVGAAAPVVAGACVAVRLDRRADRHDGERRPRRHRGVVGGGVSAPGVLRRAGRAVPADRGDVGRSTPVPGAPARGPPCWATRPRPRRRRSAAASSSCASPAAARPCTAR